MTDFSDLMTKLTKIIVFFSLKAQVTSSPKAHPIWYLWNISIIKLVFYNQNWTGDRLRSISSHLYKSFVLFMEKYVSSVFELVILFQKYSKCFAYNINSEYIAKWFISILDSWSLKEVTAMRAMWGVCFRWGYNLIWAFSQYK